MKRERGVFRMHANAAKGRLGGGFWDDMRTKRDVSIATATHNGRNGAEMLNLFVSNLKKQLSRASVDTADELFYGKVAQLLSLNPSANPLAQMLDRTYMMELGGAERERYVFSMSERVQKCIERYEQENALGLLVNG